MTTVFTTFAYKILAFMMTVWSLLGGALTPPATDDPIVPADPSSVCLTAVFWGDTQVSDYMLSRQAYVENACRDVAAAPGGADALIVAGDIAENGKGSEYRLIADDFALVDNVGEYLFAAGNHDIRLRLYRQSVKTFGEFVSAVDPAHPVQGLWYSRDINGYTFIVLGSAGTEFEEAKISGEELAWLDAELARATADGRPAFVICHQPLKNTHGLPDTWGSPIDSAGSIGAQSDAVGDVMAKYPNVFFLTGHLHTGFGEYTFGEHNGVHLVNVPSLGIKNKDGLEKRGIGFMLEIYPGRVLFRARDFCEGKYLPEYDGIFELV